MYRKVKNSNYNLGDYPVYVEYNYQGQLPFKVVGIREDSIELEGDFSKVGVSPNRDWVNKSSIFKVEKLCEQEIGPSGCQVHNIHCCGGAKIIKEHTEYWKDEYNN